MNSIILRRGLDSLESSVSLPPKTFHLQTFEMLPRAKELYDLVVSSAHKLNRTTVSLNKFHFFRKLANSLRSLKPEFIQSLKTILDDRVLTIESLTKLCNLIDKFSDEDCYICLEPLILESENPVGFFNCFHSLHQSCYDRLALGQSRHRQLSCGLCRAPIKWFKKPSEIRMDRELQLNAPKFDTDDVPDLKFLEILHILRKDPSRKCYFCSLYYFIK